MEALNAIQGYGVPAVYGRVLGVREIRRMNLAGRVVRVTRSFYDSTDWGKWQARYPDDWKFLSWVLKVANG